ncbi:MAG: hypothetical protein ACPGOV_00670 [Magnetovibrionaceae bacterium]
MARGPQQLSANTNSRKQGAHTRLVLEVRERGLWRIEHRGELAEAEAIARLAKRLLKRDLVDEVSLIAETFTARGYMDRREVLRRASRGYRLRMAETAKAKRGLFARLFGKKAGSGPQVA